MGLIFVAHPEVCPLDDPAQREEIESAVARQIEAGVAERMFPRRWLYVVTASAVTMLSMALWVYQTDRISTNGRLAIVEAFVTEQKAINAGREVTLREIRDRLSSIEQKLDTRENETEKQLRENTRMLQALVRRVGATP